MTALTIFQALVFVSYVMFILIKFGTLPSISDSWYKLKDLGGVWYSLFTWFTWLLGIPLLFQTNGDTALFFLAGAGLSFVGVATMFKLKESIEPMIHFGGALTAILGSLAGLGIERGAWLPTFAFVIVSAGIILTKLKNRTWWIEIAAFLAIIFGLIFYPI